MVKISWEYCSCNSDCALKLLEGLKFEDDCEWMRIENMDLNEEPLNCEYLRVKSFDKESRLLNSFNGALKLEKKIFSELSLVCKKHQNDKEVNKCIINFLVDPDFLKTIPNPEIFDLAFNSPKLCQYIKFSSDQLKLYKQPNIRILFL